MRLTRPIAPIHWLIHKYSLRKIEFACNCCPLGLRKGCVRWYSDNTKLVADKGAIRKDIESAEGYLAGCHPDMLWSRRLVLAAMGVESKGENGDSRRC